MPMINGRFYMNPGLGAALERARGQAGEGFVAPVAKSSEINLDPSGANGSTTAGAPGAASPNGIEGGQFTAMGVPAHRMEIEAANGRFLARLHRQQPEAVRTNGNPFQTGAGGA